MGYTWDEITQIMAIRRSEDAVIIQRAQMVTDRYNGDVALMIPSVKGEPSFKAPSPQIVTEAVEGLSQRAASPSANIFVPALYPHEAEAKRGSAAWADIRRKAYYARWHRSAVKPVLLPRAYRHYFAYGTASWIVMPDFVDGGARVELRNPLTAYPEMRSPDDTHHPLNVGFVYGRSTEWIRRQFPEAREMVSKAPQDNSLWDVVEWIDEDDIVLGILGPRYWDEGYNANNRAGWARSYSGNSALLRRWPNRAGLVPVAQPRRVTLDRIVGQVWTAVGQQDHLDRLFALEMLAAEKYVYGDIVVLGRDGRQPILIGGTWQDGRTGKANFIQDGDVKVLQQSTGVATFPTIDRITENSRRASGMIPQMTGESYGALRTGRAIDALGGFSVDPRIQEAQEVMANTLTRVNEAIHEVERGYFSSKTFVVYSGLPGDKGYTRYSPGVHFETMENKVTYPMPGTDISDASVVVGQLVQTQLMSRATGREKHPYIDDPEGEARLILLEAIDQAIIESTLSKVLAQEMALIDLVRAKQLIAQGKTPEDAILQADEEARERQAAAPPPAPEGMLAPPEAMPGIAAPGAGAEMGAQGQLPPVQAPPDQGLQNGAQLIRALQAGTSRR